MVGDGSLGGGANVRSGGTLAGTGSRTGAVDIADGGILLGVQGQTLTMASLALSNESAVAVTLGAPGNGAGLFHVTNDLALDGQLSVHAGLGHGHGIYCLFDYDRALDLNSRLSAKSVSATV